MLNFLGGKSFWGGLLVRVGQLYLVLAFGFVCVVFGVRLLVSSWFLKFEYYYRVGFPVDVFGFSAEDRLFYGSYVVDYLLNFVGIRYLGDLVFPGSGLPVFLESELLHMVDVKAVLGGLFVWGVVFFVLAVFLVFFWRRSLVLVYQSLFVGAVVVLSLVFFLGVFMVFFWERFFVGLHEVFFVADSWVFYVDDVLIRLFPETFWVDAGFFVVGFVVLVSVFVAVFSYRRLVLDPAR